jgi:hypothetical protein
MGTALCFKQISPTTLEFLKANPEYFDTFIEEAFQDYSKYGIESEPLPEKLQSVIVHDDPVGETDVYKSWDALRFLLLPFSNGKDLPVAAAVTGLNNIKIDYEDTNYGIYYFTPKFVTTLAKALEAISQKDFLANFDGPTMNKLDLYAFRWTDNEDASLKTELWDYFKVMRDYYLAAAKRGYSMLVYFN